ncbi:MAG: sugar phosphate isomerase/epimerase [Lachnospiraceae bacterium]|jgi:sugar phosphate isomerase/epimerase|nr:sugar phosphate isomerase/epimerase [Lachnospiraceae bacterium]
MAIKRGVSLYSYQQEQFFGRMTWKDMFREVKEDLHCDGIEIIDEATIHGYPFLSEQFVFDWHNELARYGLKAVTMDVYLDPMQFRDHVMNHDEAAERLKNDIVIASRLGFSNVRCLCLVPIDVIEKALPTAEKYNVRIGKEIHMPFPINAGHRRTSYDGPGSIPVNVNMCTEIMELADRTGSKHVGLVPDMGIFQDRPSQVRIDYELRHAKNPESIYFIIDNRTKMDPNELYAKYRERYAPDILDPMTLNSLAMTDSCADPEELREVVPYIVSIHGKFYNMTEIEGEPGHYEDKAIDYRRPFEVLKEEGYEGYIDSEFEGQRDQQDRGEEYLVDEVEQVRRHHEMMTRLIGK